MFEGAQGILLDEWHGFHPYTTWSTTTFANAETLLAEAGESAIRLGVIRCYMTRHGPGPFVTEDPQHDLRWQEQLTGLLLHARPDYESPGGDWPATIAELLNAPVVLASYGPAITAKRVTNCRGRVA